MLADSDAMATVAVKNLPAAAQFYEGKLGLKKVGGGESASPATSHKHGAR